MQTISFGQALEHCLSTPSYVIWLVIAVIIFGVSIWLAIKKLDGNSKILSIGIGFIVLFAAFFWRPAEISANTTEDQAARGIYIGY